MGLEKIIGSSAPMRALRERIERVAGSKVSVLIQGPSGSGKELVARALHALSGRPGDFVATNVCAVSEDLFDSAFFGHVRGAFTGAESDSPGLLREANGGTIFLDEVTGLSLSLQAKLLRAVETGSFRPLGAARDAESDFRVVSATNEDIRALVDQHRFRDDLMYRIAQHTITVPPLAAHIEDVRELAEHFIRIHGGGSMQLTDSAIRELERYGWPGNVREFQSVMAVMTMFAQGTLIRSRT